jgi:hypothetical protein
MTGNWAYLVPLLFGAAAGYVALLAMRYVLQGDSAMTERALTWVYGAAGAGFNYWHASTSPAGNVASAIFFGGASLSAVLLWDRTLRAWRRDELRTVGALEAPLPRFRALRWVLAPGQTFAAFKAAVLHGLTTPDEAIAAAEAGQIVRRDEPAGAVPAVRATELPGPVSEQAAAGVLAELPPADEAAVEPADAAEQRSNGAVAELPGAEGRVPLTELSAAAALREAWAAAGVNGVPTLQETADAVEWLRARGVTVTPKYAREVRLRQQKRTRQRPVLVKAGA